MSTKIDMKKVLDTAESEVRAEAEKAAVGRIKAIKKKIADTEVLLANYKRELELEIARISEGN